jgi:hypothetical protein
MGTDSFPGVKLPGSGDDHPTPSSAKVKERVEANLCSPLGLRGLFYGELYQVNSGGWVKFRPQLFCIRERSTQYLHGDRLIGSQTRFINEGEEKNFASAGNHTLTIVFVALLYSSSVLRTRYQHGTEVPELTPLVH